MARDITIRYVGDSTSAERAARRVADANEKMASKFADLSSSASQHFRSIGRNLTSAGRQITTFATLPIAAGFGLAIKAASDFNEEASKMETVFGNQANVITRFADTAAEKLGLSEKATFQATSTFGNMFQQLGLAPKVTAEWSMSLTQAAADLGSFHNADISQVIEAQTAAFRGEYDALQRFIPTINAANVQQVAMEQTGKDNARQLTESEKAAAAYTIMMESMGAAQGDFARTSEGAANKQRILQARFQDLAVSIGQQLLPIAVQFGEILAGLLDRFNQLSPNVRRFILIGAGLVAVLGPIVGAVGALATVIGLLISPVGLVIVAIAALAAGAVYAYKNFEGFREVVDGVVSWVTGTALPAMQAFADVIITKFQELAGWVREIWPQISEAISHAMNIIEGIIRTVIDVISKAWRLFGDDILLFVTTTWTAIQTIISGVMNVISGVIKLVLAIINGEWGKAWEAVRQIVFGVWQIILGMIRRVLAAIVLVLGSAYAVIQNAASVAWTWVKDRISSIWSTIKTKVSDAVTWVKDRLASVWDKIKTKVSNIWTGIKDSITGVWDGIKRGVRNGVNGVIGIINGLIGGINKVIDILPGNLPTIPKIGTLSAPRAATAGGLAGGGARDTGRDVPPQIAHLLGHGRQPGQTGSGMGDIPVISDVVDAIGDKLGAGADALRRGVVTAAFGPVNEAAKALLNAVPWDFARNLGQGFRETLWNWVKGEDAKLPSNTGGSGSARGLVGYAARYLPGWKQMFPWMTIGGWRSRGSVPGSDHPKGKALDLMTSSSATANQIISTFLGQAGAKYWIWNRQFASAASGWRPRSYSGPSPHTDHVHLSYFHNGGRLPEDITGVGHRTGKFYGLQGGENVIPAGRSGNGQVIEIHVHSHLDGREISETVARHTVANNGRSAARIR